MKIRIFVSLILGFLVGLMAGRSTTYQAPKTTSGIAQMVQVSPYPDSQLTPGKAATLSLADLQAKYNGLTYSQAHRSVNDTEKKVILAEYHISFPQPAGAYEIDHFYPLCAGGSNDMANLWPEPSHVLVDGEDLGFHTKDLLEAYICRQIKAGTIDTKVAFQKMTSNWVSYYHELFNIMPGQPVE